MSVRELIARLGRLPNQEDTVCILFGGREAATVFSVQEGIRNPRSHEFTALNATGSAERVVVLIDR